VITLKQQDDDGDILRKRVERERIGTGTDVRQRELSGVGRDILPGVNAGASRTAGGIFDGLRHNLFSRGENPTV
jgi:hypothetical protein